MKNLGVVGNFLMGLVVVSSIFEADLKSNTIKFWLLIFLGLAQNILAYETKFGSTRLYKDWYTGHMAIFLIYLFNLFCPVIEHHLALTIAIGIYHMFLIKKPSSFNIYGFIIGLLLYLYEGYQIFNEPEKSFVNILKLLGCVCFVIYYYSHIFGPKHEPEDKH
jgi:Mn2+/Fe2+ NRAMP family transporter